MTEATQPEPAEAAQEGDARTFGDGEFVYRVGALAHAVYRILAGAVALRSLDSGSVEVLKCGEIFGADGLISGAARRDSAVSIGESLVEICPRAAVLAALERHSSIGPLLDAVLPGLFRPVIAPRIDALRLVPQHSDIAAQIGEAGIRLVKFPFVIGRTSRKSSGATITETELLLNDAKPFQLSRRHFSIERDDGTYRVRDCGSYHGTIVNGLALGAAFGRLVQQLAPGTNVVTAGEDGSIFRFALILGPEDGE